MCAGILDAVACSLPEAGSIEYEPQSGDSCSHFK